MTRLKTHIRIRTDFEGWHQYPGAGDIDPRIKFLEDSHRHLFKVECKIEVFHNDRELEFFLVKWAVQDFITSKMETNDNSCESMALQLLNFLQEKYGYHRELEVTVSEDGESDGIIEYKPEG